MLAPHTPFFSGPTSSRKDLLASWAWWSLTLGVDEVIDTHSPHQLGSPQTGLTQLEGAGGAGKGRNSGEDTLEHPYYSLSFWKKKLKVSFYL